MVSIETTNGKLICVKDPSHYPRLSEEVVKVPFSSKVWKRIDELCSESLEARAWLGNPYRFGENEDNDEEVSEFLVIARHNYFPTREIFAKWWPSCTEVKTVVISSTENGIEDSILLDMAFDSSVTEYLIEDPDPPLLFTQKRNLQSLKGDISEDFLKTILCTNPSLHIEGSRYRRNCSIEEIERARRGTIPIPCPDQLLLLLPTTYYSEYAKYPFIRYSLVCLGLIRGDPSTYMLVSDEKRIVWQGTSRNLLLTLYRNQETVKSVQGSLDDFCPEVIQILQRLQVVTNLRIRPENKEEFVRLCPQAKEEDDSFLISF
jgi:hypothetical protein